MAISNKDLYMWDSMLWSCIVNGTVAINYWSYPFAKATASSYKFNKRLAISNAVLKSALAREMFRDQQ